MRVRPHLSIILLAILLTPVPAAADDIEDIVDSTYRNAVIKIDVSANIAVFDSNGRNICRSEGTGSFIQNAGTIVTAHHVIAIDPACGTPIILVNSRKHGWEQLAKPIDHDGDIVLLATEPAKHPGLCALLPYPRDAFETRGLRFGIPAGLTDPAPSTLRIGEEHGQFNPLVRLNPAPVVPGESGGPVLYRFNIAGVVKARHLRTDYGLMIRGNVLRNLLIKNNIARDDAFACNPSRYVVRQIDASSFSLVFEIDPKHKMMAITQNRIGRDLIGVAESTANQPMYFGKIKIQDFSAKSVTINSTTDARQPDQIAATKRFVDLVGREINEELVGTWWDRYLTVIDKKHNR